jgi:hypothetical protein
LPDFGARRPPEARTVERREAESTGPSGGASRRSLDLTAALTKVLKKEPEAAAALAELLKAHGAAVTTQTATAIGDGNKIGQASGGSTVTIG